MKSFRVKRAAVLLTAIALLLAAAVGGTIAYLVASTGEVVNTFTPTKVDIEITEKFPDPKTVKSEVRIWNTGTIPAYIRAKVVVSWKASEGGQVYGAYPDAGEDYEITWGGAPWFEADINDDTDVGYRYYNEAVLPGEFTKVPLIVECKPVGEAPEGYYLDVDILAQAIQAVPITAVEQAWGVTVTDGKISK